MELMNLERYGLQENKARDLKKVYEPMFEMLANMEAEYNELVVKTITPELCVEAAALRKRIAHPRIEADKARKKAKAEGLREGKAIQGVYNTFEYATKSKEAKLLSIENYYIELEKTRIAKLQDERAFVLSLYSSELFGSLGDMTEAAWAILHDGTKAAFIKAEAEKKQAEIDRVAAEQAAKDAVEKVKQDNIKLKAELEVVKKEKVVLIYAPPDTKDSARYSGGADPFFNDMSEKEGFGAFAETLDTLIVPIGTTKEGKSLTVDIKSMLMKMSIYIKDKSNKL